MVSIPYAVEKSQPHALNISKELSIARERITILEQENRTLKQQLSWEDKLFANPNLSPSHKLALRATVYTVRNAKSQQDGLTKIYIPALAEKTGLSAKTLGKNLQYLADTGALQRTAETETDQNGQRITRVYIGLTEQIKRPEQIAPPTPRNHGGYRSFCPSCGSENILEEKKIICTDCGTVISKTQRLINQDDQTYSQDEKQEAEEITAPPTDDLTDLLKPKEPIDNLTVGKKPATPQESEAAALLLDIVGDRSEFIVMNDNPKTPKKYLTVHRSPTQKDMLEHLQGKKTLGGTLQHIDATTRALCFDADDPRTWQHLLESAKSLKDAGYKPLLEVSPADRGGHLWLIFSDRVNAEATYNQVVTIAPILKDISEYWPSRGNQKVRLPLGKYVNPTFSKWCQLIDGDQCELARNETALLANLTPANLIPDLDSKNRQEITPPSSCKANAQMQTTGLDNVWLAKYGKSNLWFAWTQKQLADWYNQHTSVSDLLPPERNGNGLAMWRGERTASVVFRDQDAWVDFGAGGKRPDGKQDGGDCLELTTRLAERPKREIMSDIARLLLQEARAALESAAANNQEVPAWLLPFITPAGLARYEQLRSKHSRGVTGFKTPEQDPFYPPPQRVCLCCGVSAWQWTGETYICSNPGHLQE